MSTYGIRARLDGQPDPDKPFRFGVRSVKGYNRTAQYLSEMRRDRISKEMLKILVPQTYAQQMASQIQKVIDHMSTPPVQVAPLSNEEFNKRIAKVEADVNQYARRRKVCRYRKSRNTPTSGSFNRDRYRERYNRTTTMYPN